MRPMRIAVFARSGELPKEHRIVSDLFDAGLDEYHLLKPGWTATDYARFIDRFQSAQRERIVLYRALSIGLEQPVGGVHLRSDLRRPGWLPALQLSWLRRRFRRTRRYATFRTTGELARNIRHFDVALLGPVFERSPRSGYRSTIVPKALAAELARLRKPVLAFGGVQAGNVEEAGRIGFAGVVLRNAIWQAPEPVAAFSEIRSRLMRTDQAPVQRSDAPDERTSSSAPAPTTRERLSAT